MIGDPSNVTKADAGAFSYIRICSVIFVLYGLPFS